MFVGDEVLLAVSFEAAQAGLVRLTEGSSLVHASREAYGDGMVGVVRVGPLGDAPVVSRLVRVRFQEPVIRDDSALLALRWEATGPAGPLFPALDADVTLIPVDERVTLLRLAGVYRPPLGAVGAGLDRVILHRVATATIGAFIKRLADVITGPDG